MINLEYYVKGNSLAISVLSTFYPKGAEESKKIKNILNLRIKERGYCLLLLLPLENAMRDDRFHH
jgi:hypothetical protein